MRLKMVRFYLLALLFVIIVPIPAPAQISHLELGAANYGAEYGEGAKRFEILEHTVLDLIKNYGPRGVIYLNDIDRSGLNLAVDHLAKWLTEKGLVDISIVSLLGDYSRIRLPEVKSAHLSNPGADQLPSAWAGIFNHHIVRDLERVALQSETGLKITSYFTEGDQAYVPRIADYAQVTVLKKISSSGYEYHLPNGEDWRTYYDESRSINASHTSTFLLISKLQACRDLFSIK
jgi:hypothetical protein